MSWQVASFISVLLFSIVTLLQKTNLKHTKVDPISYSAFFQIFIGIAFLLVGIFSGSIQSVFNINNALFINVLLVGAIYGLGSICMFKALATTEASKFTVIFSTRLIVTIMFSAIIFGQNLLPIQMIGAFLVLAGIIFISWQKQSIKFNKGDLLSFACAFLFGIGIINDKILLNNLEVLPYLSIAFLLPGIFIFLIYPRAISKAPLILQKKTFLPLLLLCLLFGGQAVFFYMGLALAPNPSLAAVINSTTVIVTVLLSIIFLKERDNLFKKIMGSLISFVGLLLLIL